MGDRSARDVAVGVLASILVAALLTAPAVAFGAPSWSVWSVYALAYLIAVQNGGRRG
jgi:hypothetical protein